MLPPKCRGGGEDQHQQQPGLPDGPPLILTPNLTVLVVSGTYGIDLDPNFDVGSGPPDMILAYNAGLYAYASWSGVISYLNGGDNGKGGGGGRGVVGVFTDYNEHSGTNCAALGGAEARDTLAVNPFRQPRAMTVGCMNLPQFGNGFVYVFNHQELE